MTLTAQKQEWAVMLWDMLDKGKLTSNMGEWEQVEVHTKLMAPEWATLKVGGCAGEIIQKCRKAATVLRWGETIRYFKNTNFQWSPWLSKITEGYLDDYWDRSCQEGLQQRLENHWAIMGSAKAMLERSR